MTDIAAGSRTEDAAAVTGDAMIRPFRVGFPEAELTELRRRINATRWPERETVTDSWRDRPRAILMPSQETDPQEGAIMAEPTLYERLGGIFAIAAVIDNFSDRLVKNPKIVNANPELREWHTVTYHTRMPGLKWGRTLWVAMKAGGPFQYTGLEMRDAHWDLKISPEVFDEVTQELINAMDDFKVPEREKEEVLAAFGAEKGEVTAGSQPGEVNWRRWR